MPNEIEIGRRERRVQRQTALATISWKTVERVDNWRISKYGIVIGCIASEIVQPVLVSYKT